MVEIRPFQYADALSLQPPGVLEDDYRDWAWENYNKGPAWTGFVDGVLVGCAGIRILWRGCGEGWVAVCPDAKAYREFIYEAIPPYLAQIIRDHRLHRVQAHVLVDNPVHVRFVENLGFEREGVLRAYDPQRNDYFLYARVFHGSEHS